MATAYGIGGGGTSQAKVIYVGVLNNNGQTAVYALVAVGQAQIDAFFNQMTAP
jgi:hypothetical protein